MASTAAGAPAETGDCAAHHSSGRYTARLTTPAMARYRPSPAPMSTPSSTNTRAASGCVAATTHAPAGTAEVTAASEENTKPNHGAATASTTPKARPDPTPQTISRRTVARTSP